MLMRVTLGLVCISLSWAVLDLRSFGVTLLFEERVELSSRQRRWYIVGQDGDCASSLRAARQRARTTGELPERVVIASMGTAALSPTTPVVLRLRGFRRKVVLNALRLHGVRSTPVLLEYAPGKSQVHIVLLAPPRAEVVK